MSIVDKLLNKLKGEAIKESPPGFKRVEGDGFTSYVVFDLETTGTSIYYSEPVQISAIKVKNGRVVDQFDTLVKPNKENPPEAMAVNHITNEELKKAPGFNTVYPEFRRFIEDLPLVGYNICGFDLPLLNSRLNISGGAPLNAEYIDVFQSSRCLEGLPNYQLTTVAKALGINPDGAHNALRDCAITNGVLCELRKRGIHLNSGAYQGKRFTFKTKLSDENLAINVLKSILTDIVADKNVSEAEFNELRYWMSENSNLKGSYPFNELAKEIEDILADGVVEKSELNHLEAMIEEWINPVEKSKHVPIESIDGKNIVITGDFQLGDRFEVERFITDRGGIIEERVTRKTEYVVVGALGSDAWAAGNYGSKIKKALENKAKGCNTQIVKEEDFIKELGVK